MLQKNGKYEELPEIFTLTEIRKQRNIYLSEIYINIYQVISQ